MRKMALIIPLICAACVAAAPNQHIYNPKCINTNYAVVEIMQIGEIYTLLDSGETFAIKTSELNKAFKEIYDGMRFSLSGEARTWNLPPDEKEKYSCVATDGTYKYTTVLGTVKTIRKLTFVPMWITNPEYTTWKEQQEQPIEEKTIKKGEKE